MAVALVVVNRTKSGLFADDVCEVLREPNQFSFVRNRIIPKANGGSPEWRKAAVVALLTMRGWPTKAESALYFHAARIAPGWHHDRINQIGLHIFYR